MQIGLVLLEADTYYRNSELQGCITMSCCSFGLDVGLALLQVCAYCHKGVLLLP